jgi:methylated-DNA-protein-cysteine methyltransferase-like protein
MPPISKRSAPSRGTFARILDVVARIPRGRVATYGQVARLAGVPGAARTVGWALASAHGNIPWHRVINAQGGISPRDGEERQALRLRREGVRPRRNGRYDLVRYGWDGAAAKSATPRRSN